MNDTLTIPELCLVTLIAWTVEQFLISSCIYLSNFRGLKIEYGLPYNLFFRLTDKIFVSFIASHINAIFIPVKNRDWQSINNFLL